MHYIAVAQYVVLALEPSPPGLAGALLAAIVNKIIIGDGLGADKSAFEVGVYLPCRLRCNCAYRHRPCPHFLRSGGKESLQAKQPVTRLDHPIEARLPKPEVLQKSRVLARLKIRYLLFDGSAHHHELGLGFCCMPTQRIHLRIAC